MATYIIRLFLGIALTFSVSVANADPVEYSFSSTSVRSSDALLLNLTSVSGSFVYDKDVALIELTPDGRASYQAWHSLSGAANGSDFEAITPGVVRLYNDTFQGTSDFFILTTGSRDFPLGLNFEGLEMVNVTFTWIEGHDGIPDFLNDLSLPSELPPVASGIVRLTFEGDDQVPRYTYLFVDLVKENPVESQSINFHGELVTVLEDSGSAVFTGISEGALVSGGIDLVSGRTAVSSGILNAKLSAGYQDGSLILWENGIELEALDAALINSFSGLNFTAGDEVDLIAFDTEVVTETNGYLSFGLVYMLHPDALDDVNPVIYPPDPDDILLIFFEIYEEDELQEVIFDAVGLVNYVGEKPPPKLTLNSDGSPTTGVISGGVSPDSGISFSTEFKVGNTIRILANIVPEFSDVGKNAELFVVVAVGDNFRQVTPNGVTAFDGTLEGLISFDEITLADNNDIDVLAPFGGSFTLTSSEVGNYKFFIGYSSDGGVITYNEEAIILNVAN